MLPPCDGAPSDRSPAASRPRRERGGRCGRPPTSNRSRRDSVQPPPGDVVEQRGLAQQPRADLLDAVAHDHSQPPMHNRVPVELPPRDERHALVEQLSGVPADRPNQRLRVIAHRLDMGERLFGVPDAHPGTGLPVPVFRASGRRSGRAGRTRSLCEAICPRNSASRWSRLTTVGDAYVEMALPTALFESNPSRSRWTDRLLPRRIRVVPCPCNRNCVQPPR